MVIKNTDMYTYKTSAKNVLDAEHVNKINYNKVC